MWRGGKIFRVGLFGVFTLTIRVRGVMAAMAPTSRSNDSGTIRTSTGIRPASTASPSYMNQGGKLSMTSSPRSATDFIATEIAENPPVVSSTSSGSKGTASNRRSPAAATSWALGKYYVSANQSLSWGVRTSRSVAT